MRRIVIRVSLALLIHASATTTHAAFVVEADNSGPLTGKAFDHFVSNPPGTGFSLSSSPSQAVGLQGDNSAFGNPTPAVPDRYEFFYTPGVDLDNTLLGALQTLGNSSASDADGADPGLPSYSIATVSASGFGGGATGMYNVYFTVPSSLNVHASGSVITVNNDSAPVVLNPVVMNDGNTGPDMIPGGTFTGGANHRWLLLGNVPLTTGNTYSVVVEANSTDFVSQRAHGVMWEYTGPLGGNEIEPNDSIATAQNIDGLFNLNFSSDIGNRITNTSTIVPHATVNGTGNGTFDYYSFTVANAGDIGFFDIDYTSGLDSFLQLYTAAGDLLLANDDNSTSYGQGGSSTGLDSYLEHTFTAPGTYVIGVGSCCVGPVNAGTSYTLHASVGPDPRPVLDNGSLRVEFSEASGAISKAQFGGSDYYNPGSSVSDWGLQVDTDTSTFAINTTTGNIGTPVTVAKVDDTVVVSGNYAPGNGVDLTLTRTYSLVPGLNVLRVASEIVNNGVDAVISYFDTFDPDQGENQGNGFNTFNDVYTPLQGAATVGQATELGLLSVAIGSLDPLVTVASGSPFAIFDGFSLNDFFDAPFDGNGLFADEGTHVGIRRFLAAGGSFRFTFDQAYGLSASQARGEFIAANVPEPSAAALVGCLICAVAAFRRQHWKREAV
jgi:hypothetical protein